MYEIQTVGKDLEPVLDPNLELDPSYYSNLANKASIYDQIHDE